MSTRKTLTLPVKVASEENTRGRRPLRVANAPRKRQASAAVLPAVTPAPTPAAAPRREAAAGKPSGEGKPARQWRGQPAAPGAGAGLPSRDGKAWGESTDKPRSDTRTGQPRGAKPWSEKAQAERSRAGKPRPEQAGEQGADRARADKAREGGARAGRQREDLPREDRARDERPHEERRVGFAKPQTQAGAGVARKAEASAPGDRKRPAGFGQGERPARAERPERQERPEFTARKAASGALKGGAPAALRPAKPQAAHTQPSRPAATGKAEARPAAGIRISKLLSELGLCSRREADSYIERGWVFVDGKRVTELGARAAPTSKITLAPEAQVQQTQRATILLHKPVGYVSGQPEPGCIPAVKLILPENQYVPEGAPARPFRPGILPGLAPAGRLDIDSTGLLVLTQDGRIARALIGDHSTVDKEYLVRVEGEVTEEGLKLLNHGLSLDGRELRPAKVERLNDDQLRFVLREGRKRQIRRMCELVGLKVVGLKRVRIGGVRLGLLPLGQWRYLGDDESF